MKLDKTLFHPKRFVIATVLYLRGPTLESELKRITGLSWGDLDSNLRRLASEGIVETRRIVTRDGPRVLVYLTEEGRRRYEELVDQLREQLEALERARGGESGE